MRKKIKLYIITVLLIFSGMLTPTMVCADAFPPGTWVQGWSMQEINTQTAHINDPFSFKNQFGTVIDGHIIDSTPADFQRRGYAHFNVHFDSIRFLYGRSEPIYAVTGYINTNVGWLRPSRIIIPDGLLSLLGGILLGGILGAIIGAIIGTCFPSSKRKIGIPTAMLIIATTGSIAGCFKSCSDYQDLRLSEFRGPGGLMQADKNGFFTSHSNIYIPVNSLVKIQLTRELVINADNCPLYRRSLYLCVMAGSVP